MTLDRHSASRYAGLSFSAAHQGGFFVADRWMAEGIRVGWLTNGRKPGDKPRNFDENGNAVLNIAVIARASRAYAAASLIRLS